MDNTFEIYKDLSECQDSMLFDCYERIATYGNESNYVALDVYGDVKVFYKDEMYERASEMPDELLDKFKKANYMNDDDFYVANNNWFAYVHVLNGVIQPNDIVCEDYLSEMSAQQLKEDMEELWSYFNMKGGS